MSNKDVNLELVKAMGSKKGYDPMPPDQYLYFLTSDDEVQRVLAWVRSKTIRQGWRSPFAINKKGGRPHTKADLARDCFGRDRGLACRAWDRAEEKGLVSVNQKGFLCLNGEVQMPPKKRRRKGEPEQSVLTALPRYLTEKIGALPEASRKAALAHYTALLNYRNDLETEALTMARIQGDRIEDSINRHYFGSDGKRRLDKKVRPDLHDKGSKLVQLNLLLVPEELQEFAPAGPAVCTDSENLVRTDSTELSVRTAPEVQPEPYLNGHAVSLAPDVPLQTSKRKGPETISRIHAERETITTTAHPGENSESEIVVIVQKLGVKPPRVKAFLEDCRQQSPGCTVEDIVTTIDQVEASINKRKYPNFTPILLDTVPLRIAGVRKAATLTAPELTCPRCHGSLEAGAADGLCLSCTEQQQRAEAELDEQVSGAWKRMPEAEKDTRLRAAAIVLRAEARWKRMAEPQRAAETDRYARIALRRDVEAGDLQPAAMRAHK